MVKQPLALPTREECINEGVLCRTGGAPSHVKGIKGIREMVLENKDAQGCRLSTIFDAFAYYARAH